MRSGMLMVMIFAATAQATDTVPTPPRDEEEYTRYVLVRCCAGTGPCDTFLEWEPFEGTSLNSEEEALQNAHQNADDNFDCSEESPFCEERSPPRLAVVGQRPHRMRCRPAGRFKASVSFYCCHDPNLRLIHHGYGHSKRAALCAARAQVCRTAQGMCPDGRHCVYRQQIVRCRRGR